ncbi:ABC transporter substrate-binding protein [Natronobeatus ordinarius]|uniref:ABC transporter substrate-binding protein n=1 Tax=Natronobeatus ordinarius TaxID=2963433 RepID=UPI0020CC0DEC|nr:ABC transporter substrate-binding protein [Natronobeatus ordinarius]
MDSGPITQTDGTSRRALLAAAATGVTAATAGCVRQARSVITRDAVDRLSVTIATVPSDYDREAVQLARRLGDNLEAVGIGVSIDFLARDELPRAVLVNHDFDLYVGRHPDFTDPDFLYEALHSRYADESGWQNPFGFTSMAFDELLERQRTLEGEPRRGAVVDVLEGVAEEQPFVPICVPEEYRLVRDDRAGGWDDGHLATRLGYLGLETPERDAELRAAIVDTRPTKNLNPLSVEYREQGTVVDLLYDSLGTVDDGELRPWLARSWEWDGSTATVELREGVRWHDGEALTAADVAFTYRLLEDTTLGDGSVPSPAPRYRGLTSLVDEIELEDEHTLSLSVTAGPDVGSRAFTVPILPEHVWADRTDEASIPGVRVAQGTTEALVTDNVPPVGSGPFAFAERTERDVLVLERFDDHFTTTDDALPGATVERLRILVHPRSTSAIEAVEAGDADVTITPLEAYSVETVSESSLVRLLTSPSTTFYHVGFNARNAPFSNPYFRRTVAGLLDKAWLVEEVFEGYARPIATPATDAWTPDSLAFEGEDPAVPFFGSDGELDERAARSAFEEAGFRYDEEGHLLARH